MKKSYLIGILIIIILAAGGYLIFHKSPKPTANNNSTGTSSQNQTAAVNNSVVKTKTSASLGQYLTDPNGKALYTYSADSSGVSNCTGSCLGIWPPYLATATLASLPANINTIKRTDTGATQYTYKGLPLYYFASDSSDQATGNGIGGFTLAKP